MMMTKQKPTLTERLNIGDEVRELKLGATFNPKNTSTAFHTIKYDFKPASVDTSRMATVDVGSNNQVTVTVPNLESSGVPHTVYKGNHKKYTKECLIIFDKETGAITIEKLNHNIQVKKTRSEVSTKPSLMPATNAPSAGPNGSGPGPAPLHLPSSGPRPQPENSTMRITSKTKVSTGSRRNNIIDYKPRNSPMQQSSPSRPVASHRSPQSAPAWHANNAQQTLPSIPMLLDDDDFGLGAAMQNGGQANVSGSSTGSSAGQPDYASSHMGKQRQAPLQNHAKRQQLAQRSSPPMQHQQQQQQHHHQPQQQQNYGRGGSSNNYAQPLQQQRSSFSNHSNSNSMPLDLDSPSHHEQSVAQAAAALEQQIGSVLSASSSSSDSDSSDSDSGSDSDDSTDQDERPAHRQQQQQQPPAQQSHQHQMQQQHQHNQQQQQQHLNQLPNLGLGSISPAYNSHQQQQSHHHHHQQQQQQQQHHQLQMQQQQSGIYASNNGFPNDLLQNDLQLSSNSSDDDDD
ncbi:hypothetical protein KR093_001668 [Drosophila rubida]|uniref:Ell-associated factor Eaf n=1 Tax=Drosophila rubida TaxID=30044 RepID=A0AAD4JZV5_9MUSC|nr:hypothetical protein KR093_001668 [Drosophila rubida]